MSGRAQVLVVEDDLDFRELLVLVLEKSGHDVVAAATGAEALAQARASDPDLITLDLTLPDADGIDVCRELRTFTDAYIVMITGRSEQTDRLVGLDLGADDYLTKPFSAQEVRARVGALLRRPRASQQLKQAAAAEQARSSEPTKTTESTESTEPVVLDVGEGLVVRPDLHTASFQGAPIPMTPAEVDLLAVLAGSSERTFSRSELAWAVWQGEFIESDYLVDIHVGNVRRKLRQAGSARQWILTVGGTAYTFADLPRDRTQA